MTARDYFIDAIKQGMMERGRLQHMENVRIFEFIQKPTATLSTLNKILFYLQKEIEELENALKRHRGPQ